MSVYNDNKSLDEPKADESATGEPKADESATGEPKADISNIHIVYIQPMNFVRFREGVGNTPAFYSNTTNTANTSLE